MAGIGVDLDARHQRTAEAEAAGDRVVMDPVLGLRRDVVGADLVGRGHGVSSPGRDRPARAGPVGDAYRRLVDGPSLTLAPRGGKPPDSRPRRNAVAMES